MKIESRLPNGMTFQLWAIRRIDFKFFFFSVLRNAKCSLSAVTARPLQAISALSAHEMLTGELEHIAEYHDSLDKSESG
jgi:hypothetical protein